MKFSSKKILALLLSLTICISLAASCTQSDNPKDGKEKETESREAESAKAIKSSDDEADYLPDETYGGYEFRIVTPPNGYFNMISLEADVEEETGDTLYDAIYKRNRIIEQKYDIVFKNIIVDNFIEMLNTFTKGVLTASNDFDLCTLLPRDAWSQALEGTVVPVNELPYLDISRPWYVHDVNSQLSIDGKQFFAYSDECLNMIENTCCVLFNKHIALDLGLENMYNLVNDGRWTLDKFFDLAKTAAIDLDGNGIMTENDQYGILAEGSDFFPTAWISSGVKTVSKNKDDFHAFSGQDEKLYNILDKVYENLYTGQKIYFDGFRETTTLFGSDGLQVTPLQFSNNYGLFDVCRFAPIPSLRGMETDFGILPFPKYDENQEKYYSSSGNGWINVAPISAPDLGRTSAIMEALAVESKNHTVPAYTETVLRTKSARDDESQEMLDIIYANRTLDLGTLIYWNDVGSIYVMALINQTNNYASEIEKNLNIINDAIQKSNEIAATLN